MVNGHSLFKLLELLNIIIIDYVTILWYNNLKLINNHKGGYYVN